MVRLRVPDHYPEFTDIVYGKVGKNLKPGRRADDAYEDPVLLKSDGLPTYHLANVVDDHHMKITHVIRGTEWLPATAKHLAMYHAFGWAPPVFAHVGLLVDEAGNKLSKRNFDTDIASFRDRLGIFPEALTNFVTLLGWSHQGKKDFMTMQELVDKVCWTVRPDVLLANTIPVHLEVYQGQHNRYAREALVSSKQACHMPDRERGLRI